MPKRDIIVIGASAGGVEALCDLTKKLPKDLPATVFIVMHIGSESALPKILSRCGALPAKHAEDNARYKRGQIYVAPSNQHLAIKDGMTVLRRGPRENGHRPAIDVLFRSAARTHRSRVTGVILSGGLDDGSAGLFAIKTRGGVAIVQDPREASTPEMPRNALNAVDVDFCLPVSQIARVLSELARGKATSTTDGPNGGEIDMPDQIAPEDPAIHHPETHIPLACPECSGPLYEYKEGDLSQFRCFVGHIYSPKSLSEQHTEALERALWVALRTLKERIMLHEKLLATPSKNKSDRELRKRFEESIGTAKKDVELLQEILDRI
jgi:two-component system, chemotaxis family, protein-glutamate methylesterase/glutaminase